MRLIKSNNIESEYPKRHICDECGAELEYDEADTHIGWMGCEYVTCPACDKETAVGECRVQPPTWKATFHHTCSDNGVFDVPDHEIGVYVDRLVKALCSDACEPGDSIITYTGNLLIFGRKWEDNVDIYVTKDYWKDSIAPEDYEMVK